MNDTGTVLAYTPDDFAKNIGDFMAYATVPIPIPLVILVLLFALVWRFSK